MSIPADDKLFQYQVDFEPNEERRFVRKMLVRDFHEQLPKYFYFGNFIITTQQLNNDKSPVVFTTRRKSDDALVQITMREMGEVLPKDLYNMTGLEDEKRAKFLLGKAMDREQLDNMSGLSDEMSIPADDKLFQYRVDFEPDEERSFIRKMLVRDFHEQLPKYLFDGTILFTTQQLNNDKSPVVFTTRRKSDNALIQITMREVEEGEVLPMDNYYKQIKSLTDLSNEIKFKLGRPDAAGLSRAMATDLSNVIKFKLRKAMAECTRQTPDEELEPPTRFSQRSNDTNEIKQLLSDWKLKFAKEQEKFNANNPEVNWGNVIQKFRMTPSGSCGKWAVIYPPRDEGETKQFVANLVKVSPSLGLVLGCPKTFKLLDDRPATYIQQLHKTMDLGPDLVIVVMPDNKGEHYYAINRKYDMEALVSSGKWAVIYPPRVEGPTKEEFGKDENDKKLKEFGIDENGEKLKEFGMDENGEKLKEFGMDENGEKLKQFEDEKDVVGCFSKFKAFMKLQWKKIVGCFGCLRPNTDLDKSREKGDKEFLLPDSTFISANGDLMKVGRPKLSK